MKRQGFTLVELMVAVAIAALLIGAVSAATNQAVRAAELRKSLAREDEVLSRAIELLRDDWRGRLRVVDPQTKPPAGSTILMLATASDGVSLDARRSSRLVTYVASVRGLRRREGTVEAELSKESARLEFWNGGAWQLERAGPDVAIRVSLGKNRPIILR